MDSALEVLFAHIGQKIDLQEKDRAVLSDFFKLRRLKRRQYLLQEGDFCRYLSFITDGLLKSFSIDDKGGEHIILLAWEGWWISDFESFVKHTEAKLYIEAVEPTTVLMLSKDNYEMLLEQFPIMERYFRILYQNSLTRKDSRLISSNTHNAEEKFKLFMETYPTLHQRVPQNLIASYLGLSAETVSRLKKKRFQQQS
ncbi:Crp/Fnr family transcriptional regulator [Sphingobacterium yanglingense]|uniref:CRP-like cAMP-binding protein n=1 Tax=Sphingobacterium yanglingense TaxID=1437280 RepID=A0A4R6WL68_9SPHI|nr:Crp/Fnr family transcriptional regulator [Sphingobacterium yanglingense]TDQ79518.1 CRP-like cAMP-binding protein [Sphingobacterium yanglingense]